MMERFVKRGRVEQSWIGRRSGTWGQKSHDQMRKQIALSRLSLINTSFDDIQMIVLPLTVSYIDPFSVSSRAGKTSPRSQCNVISSSTYAQCQISTLQFPPSRSVHYS